MDNRAGDFCPAQCQQEDCEEEAGARIAAKASKAARVGRARRKKMAKGACVPERNTMSPSPFGGVPDWNVVPN